MKLALGIASAVLVGSLNGILIANAMYGRWPGEVIEDVIEGIARWVGRRL